LERELLLRLPFAKDGFEKIRRGAEDLSSALLFLTIIIHKKLAFFKKIIIL